MGKIVLGFKLESKDIVFTSPNADVETLPETEFFKLRNSGAGVGNYLPLPESIQKWDTGTVYGELSLIGRNGSDLFLIFDDKNMGLTLFHYVCTNEEGTSFQMSNIYGARPIYVERRNNTMANPLLNYDGGRRNVSDRPSVREMDFENNRMETQSTGNTSNAITSGQSKEFLCREILGSGYVAGYVVKYAPEILMRVNKTRQSDSQYEYTLGCYETKPRGILKVCLAIPARCIMRNGALASPMDIRKGMVDYKDYQAGQMQYFSVSEGAAVQYIHEIGDRLAEYAPNVLGKGAKQWSPEDIRNEKADVTYVDIKYRVKNNVDADGDNYIFSLKSSSKRNCLFTRNNVFPVTGREHVSVNCKTEQEMYELNESAFGGWRRRMPPNGEQYPDYLKWALAKVDTHQLWTKRYNVVTPGAKNGQPEPTEGLGSVFFMATQEEHAEGSDNIITRRPCNVVRWWSAGGKDAANKEEVEVTRIVRREQKMTKGTDKKPPSLILRTIPVRYRGEDKNNEIFKEYLNFKNTIVREGYITESELESLSGKNSGKNSKGKKKIDKNAMAALESRSESASILSEVKALQNKFFDAAIDKEYGRK